jgi:hypothetical protein
MPRVGRSAAWGMDLKLEKASVLLDSVTLCQEFPVSFPVQVTLFVQNFLYMIYREEYPMSHNAERIFFK